MRRIEMKELCRGKLGFVSATKKAFLFLTEEYGMRCVKSNAEFVSYKSDKVFLRIWHEPLSYELYVRIGLVSRNKETSYGLEDVLEMVLGIDHNVTTFYQASTLNKVENSVSDMANVVKKYYQPFLRGQRESFALLATVATARAEKITKNLMLQQMREKASLAWQKKNYSKVIEIYGPYRSELTSSEVKKLEYSLKHKDDSGEKGDRS
jgi:hypothetical protein